VFFLDFLGMASNRPYTRSTHGAPRDSVGGLSKVGSMGSTGLGSVPSKKTLVEEAHVAEEVVAQMDPSDEVRISESSPSDSDCDFREVIKSGGKGGRSVEPGLVTEGLLADQVYVEMPQSDRGDVGDTEGNQGGVAAAGRAEKDVGGTLKAPWVNLFKDNRNVGIGIKLDEVDVEGDLVMLEEDDVDEVEKSWGFCLVGHFAGRFPGVTAVRTITEGWKVKCTYRLHKSGWIIFRFKEEEDRLNVLNGGPYFAYGRSLLLKILPRCFRFGGEDFAIVPVWVQLPGLPLDCWNERALSKIMSRVGKPISTDKMTRTKERLSFARVLVEVDASKELVTGVDLRLPTGEVYNQQVVFEFYPKYCKKCKIFGHVDGDCKKESEGGKLSGYVPNRKVQSAGVKGGASSNIAEDQPAVPGSDPPVDGQEGGSAAVLEVAQSDPAPSNIAVEGTARTTGGTARDNKGKFRKKSGQQVAAAEQRMLAVDLPTRQSGEVVLSAQTGSPRNLAAKDKEVGVGNKTATGSGGGIALKKSQNTPVVKGSKAVADASVSRSGAVDGDGRPSCLDSVPKVKHKGKGMQSS